MKITRILFVFLLTFATASASFAGVIDINARVPKVDIGVLVQECPNFSSYPGYRGVVWQKNVSYEIDTGGSMSVTTVWVLLARDGIDKKWLDWEIKIPDGGRAEILQAAVFDPGSLKEQARITPTKTLDALEVKFTPLPDEYILVLSSRQIYSRKLAVQDILWLSEDIPVWEQIITAKSGQKLEYKTNTNIEPVVSKIDGEDLYTWTLVNQMPAVARSLREDARPWLAFGSGRQGYENLAPAEKLAGKASENRLTVSMNLDMTKEGSLTGSLNFVVRGAWKKFSGENYEEILREVLGANAEKIIAGKPTVTTVKNAVEIEVNLKPVKIILGTLGTNAIVPLPAVQPIWLVDMGKAPAPFKIIFPLTVEVNYRFNLPDNVKDVLLPKDTDVGYDKIKYSEKYTRRKGRIEVAVRLSVGTTSIGSDEERDLKPALARWNERKTIPIRVK